MEETYLRSAVADADLQEGAQVLRDLQKRVTIVDECYQNISSRFDNEIVTEGYELWTKRYKVSLDGLLLMISFGEGKTARNTEEPSQPPSACGTIEEDDCQFIVPAPDTPADKRKRAASVETEVSDDLHMPNPRKKKKRDITKLLQTKISEVLTKGLSATDQAKIPELVAKLLGIFLLSSPSIAETTDSQEVQSDVEDMESDGEPSTEPPSSRRTRSQTRSQATTSDTDESNDDIEITHVEEDNPRYLTHSSD